MGAARFFSARGAELIKRLLNDESGQGTTEYLILLSAVILFTTTLVRQVLNIMDQGVLTLGGTLEQDLKSGRTPLRAWKN